MCRYRDKKTGGIVLVECSCYLKIGDNWVKGISYFKETKLREMFVTTEEDFDNFFEKVCEEVEL